MPAFQHGAVLQVNKLGRDILAQYPHNDLYTVECSKWVEILITSGGKVTYGGQITSPSFSQPCWYDQPLQECNIKVEVYHSNNPEYRINGNWVFPMEWLELAEPPKPFTTNTLGDFPKREVV